MRMNHCGNSKDWLRAFSMLCRILRKVAHLCVALPFLIPRYCATLTRMMDLFRAHHSQKFISTTNATPILHDAVIAPALHALLTVQEWTLIIHDFGTLTTAISSRKLKQLSKKHVILIVAHYIDCLASTTPFPSSVRKSISESMYPLVDICGPHEIDALSARVDVTSRELLSNLLTQHTRFYKYAGRS